MQDPRTLSILDFSYALPEDRIARYPLPERDASNLLIYTHGLINRDIYKNLADHLPEDSLVIFNDTKVVEARLFFQKSSGAMIEIFCLAPHEQYPDISHAMQTKERVLWQCLIGGASKWKHGQVLKKNISSENRVFNLYAAFIEKKADHFIISLSWDEPELSFAEVLHLAGAIPLPPYIKRPAEAEDASRYQTIYANHDGSVAAPTAGLHFTDAVLNKLKEKNIRQEFITLHVGAGTFKPVKSATMHDHDMHAESFTVCRDFIQTLMQYADKKIIAVGTTTLRTIESLYWMGLKMKTEKLEYIPEILQWEVYDMPAGKISMKESLRVIHEWMVKNEMESFHSRTQIIIAPGYKIKIASGLITNFHQPQSTLLLLVAAFIGKDWKQVYVYALENGFRFLSYGDGNLLWKNQD